MAKKHENIAKLDSIRQKNIAKLDSIRQRNREKFKGYKNARAPIWNFYEGMSDTSKQRVEEGKIFNKIGDYLVGGYTESEIEKYKKIRERDEQTQIKHEAKMEPITNWIKSIFGLESPNIKDKKMENAVTAGALGGVSRTPSPKAHENINNLLLVESLNRIAHSTDLFGSQALYEGQTRGGDKRHILRNFGGGTGKENLQLIDHLLRSQIKAEPTFSDTLTTEELPEVRKNMAQAGHPLRNIWRMIMGR